MGKQLHNCVIIFHASHRPIYNIFCLVWSAKGKLDIYLQLEARPTL